MRIVCLVLLFPLGIFAQPFSAKEIKQWQTQAANCTIYRDNWGIPHIYGQTDADAVFGLVYAQCEDDFARVEMNYIEKLGRLAEIEGEKLLYNDLQIRLLIDSSEAIADYNKTAPWLRKLLEAYASGINYFLYKNPQIKPALIHRFQPWFPLLWTDGSIGAISTGGATVNELKNFYSGAAATAFIDEPLPDPNPSGSNGFAFSPTITKSGKSILYINPHVTFYFRPEVHMVSKQGLNAYGAVTWGQFFIYQGFNEHCGWMHTSSQADVADLYAEQVVNKNEGYVYIYEGKEHPVEEKNITIKVKTTKGMEARTFTTYRTHHGPVMAKRKGQWISLKSFNRSMTSLIQSWERTKANSFAAFKKTMNRLANTSNNTVYADAEGNIAYWHGNFIPVRDTSYNWTEPVDGTTRSTEWQGLHPVAKTVHMYNPPNGWLQNCNSSAYTMAGENSPKKENFPAYMAPDPENFRGLNAVRILKDEKDFTIDKVIAKGYHTHMPAFEVLIPALLKAYENASESGNKDWAKVKEPIEILKSWNYNCSANDPDTTLAIEWGEQLWSAIMRTEVPDGLENNQVNKTKLFAAQASPANLLQPMVQAVNRLEEKFGTWEIPWGDINRFQRISGNVNPVYSDELPSIPVAFTASQWGTLPAYSSRSFPGTKKRYGVHGNSFVCVVEFGKRIEARSLLAGGQSRDPDSPHFFDQGESYAQGEFKTVYFYKEDVEKNAKKVYIPGN